LEYKWDDSIPQDQRVHTVSKVITKCPAHASTPNDVAHYATIVKENQGKNITLARIAESFPELAQVDANGNSVIKDGEVQWSFDKDRNLKVTAPKLSTVRRAELQSFADSVFRAHKAF